MINLEKVSYLENFMHNTRLKVPFEKGNPSS